MASSGCAQELFSLQFHNPTRMTGSAGLDLLERRDPQGRVEDW